MNSQMMIDILDQNEDLKQQVEKLEIRLGKAEIQAARDYAALYQQIRIIHNRIAPLEHTTAPEKLEGLRTKVDEAIDALIIAVQKL